MIRLSREEALSLVGLVDWALHQGAPSPLNHVAERLHDMVGGDESQNVSAAFNALMEQPRHLDCSKLKQDLANRIVEDDDEFTNEVTLLETITSIVSTPFARNVIGGEALQELRSAILLPSAQAGLTERLASGEGHCAGCGLPLADSELVNWRSRGNVYCQNCSQPHYTRCKNKHVIALNDKQKRMWGTGGSCPKCQADKEVKGVTITANEMMDAEPFVIHNQAQVNMAQAPAMNRNLDRILVPRGRDPLR